MPRPLILVVEDDIAVREPLEKFLSLHGFDVATADTADAALAAIRERPPAAAVIDLRLPQGSGREVIQGISPSTPVLIFSAVPDQSANLERLRPNTRLIVKPFSLLMLVETLQKMLQGSKSER